MRVKWTRGALGDLKEAVTYIQEERPQAARRMAARIRAQVREAAEFPHLGRMVPEIGDESIRERIVRPYRIIYRVGTDQIAVLAVIHGRRSFPEELSD